jgi:hypothetical protein
LPGAQAPGAHFFCGPAALAPGRTAAFTSFDPTDPTGPTDPTAAAGSGVASAGPTESAGTGTPLAAGAAAVATDALGSGVGVGWVLLHAGALNAPSSASQLSKPGEALTRGARSS